jgi:hypothetical protein
LSISLKTAKEIFYLDQSSPSGLRWNIDKYSGVHNQFHCVIKDSVAGSFSKYWAVVYNYEPMQCHRLIIMMTQEIEDCDIVFVDHKDGDTRNNAINNLIISSPKLNSRNKKKSSLNKTGKTGVFIITTKNKKAARAQWYDLDGNRRTKNFSFNLYGEEQAMEMAISVRDINIQILQNNNAGYSERHGK